MRVRDIKRHGAPLDIDSAWDFHCSTRERTHPRTGADIIRQKADLQRTLETYREAVQENFGIDLKSLETPKLFYLDKDVFFTHTKNGHNGKAREYPAESKQHDRRWYHALEGMRAQELQKHFNAAIEGIDLPSPSQGDALTTTDVGSRSGYFSTLMNRRPVDESPRQTWAAVDIKNPKEVLPAAVHPRGGFTQIEPFADIPKSDIITLNCVLHHVGERDDNPGTFDESKVDQFIGSVRDALPKDGLVVLVEDFIGKDKEEASYNNFIKGMDTLFYPKAPGNQKPSAEWIKKFEAQGFKLEKETYPIGFNVVGFPVVETLLVFRKK